MEENLPFLHMANEAQCHSSTKLWCSNFKQTEKIAQDEVHNQN